VADEGVSSSEVREPRSLTLLQRVAAYVTACSVIAGAGFAVWHFVFGNNGGPVIAQSGTVESVAFTPRGTSASVDTQVHILGEQGKQVHVTWTLMDAELSGPVDEPGFLDQPLAAVIPTSNDFKRLYSASVPAPNTTDLVFLRVKLLDPSGQQLDFADSKPFRIGGTPSSP